MGVVAPLLCRGLFACPTPSQPLPALVPVADLSRVRILLNGEPLLAREGEVLIGTRTLDVRRGVLLSAWTHRTPAGISVTGRELRLLSLADRAAGLQLCGFRSTATASTLSWRPASRWPAWVWNQCFWSRTSVLGAPRARARAWQSAGAATLRLGDDVLAPIRPFPLRWAWRSRSVAGQAANLIAASR